MSYNFNNIFTYFAKDEHWVKKVLVVASYYLIAVFLVILPVLLLLASYKSKNFSLILFSLPACLVIAGLLFCAPNGFCIKAGNMRLKDANASLPELKNFFEHVFIGFKYALGCVILYFPILLMGLAIYLYDPEYYNNSADNYTLVYFMYDISSRMLSTVLSCFMPAFFAMFLENLNPFVFFNYKKAVLLIKNNFVPYLVYLGIVFAANILLGFSSLLIFVIIGIALVPLLDVFFTLICVETGVQFLKLENKKANIDVDKE